MPTLDPATLPDPLPQYFARSTHTDAATLFSPQAWVKDEGEWHHGQAAIAYWLQSVQERYHPHYEVRQAETDQDRIIITFEVSGTFPGSPALLQQAFTIDSHQRITSLETL